MPSTVMPVRRWAINGRFLTQPMTGVQRYGWEIVSALDRALDHAHPLTENLQLEILIPRGPRPSLSLKNISTREINFGQGYLWEQFVLAPQSSGGLLSLCNVGPIAARRHIVCIHDANTRVTPLSYSWKFRMAYRLLMPLLAHMARQTTTVSNYSAQQLGLHGIAAPAKIQVVPDGHEHALSWRRVSTPATKRAAKPGTVIVIGSRAPHKNLKLLLGLADKMAAEGLSLAIVGMENGKVFLDQAREPSSPNVLWLGRLTDGEIAEILSHALCLALPSFTEGFGLPAVEAMAVGCPVAVSDRGSLPEICGQAALYASPDDPEAWLRNFVKLRDDATLRQRLVQQGRMQVAAFSWARSAEIYLELMADIDGCALSGQAHAHARKIAAEPRVSS